MQNKDDTVKVCHLETVMYALRLLPYLLLRSLVVFVGRKIPVQREE
jgi:hypothetical protein